jgi:hypothetical protein
METKRKRRDEMKEEWIIPREAWLNGKLDTYNQQTQLIVHVGLSLFCLARILFFGFFWTVNSWMSVDITVKSS